MYNDSHFTILLTPSRPTPVWAARRAYFTQTYGLMAAALAVTFAAALIVARFFPQIAFSTPVVIGLCVASWWWSSPSPVP